MRPRTSIGLEIRSGQLNAVALQQRGRRFVVTSTQSIDLDEKVLDVRFQHANVCQSEAFIAAVQAVMDPLAVRDRRIAVALPDEAGRLFLLGLDSPFKTDAEGAQLIRWRLKEWLPESLSHRMALDYQILQRQEGGEKRVLAACLHEKVRAQYEALLDKAGFAAQVIDFHALSLYNAYRSRIDLGRDFFLIGIDGNAFSLQVFIDEILAFNRQRQVLAQPQAIFQEINRSLAAVPCDEIMLKRLTVYLHSDWTETVALLDAVSGAFEQPVVLLQAPFSAETTAPGVLADQQTAPRFTVAFGVAQRLLKRVIRWG
ncbi:pilus assembly protein PilM [uncultured Desulfuromonas sp.]|uniref:type IV pilus biogenesis protein PilM n=1 Tax=uncultured Desulfuromonas sp. TaxID=181013 RepID=UPI002AABB105|nr:pilus assembly protein PilM [uncultured Desulfuromonas sp.]